MADSQFFNGPKYRCGEALRFLPVAFVCAIIGGLYFIYVWLHCWPLINDPGKSLFGQWQLIIVNIVTLMLVICFLKSMIVHPGSIPEVDEDPSWVFERPSDARKMSQSSEDEPLTLYQELKRSGDRRHCKWCVRYKPDRCHHCRVCQTCILKMDHHCPWLYNCVGFRNHKFFFLLLFYATINTHFITWTMFWTVRNSVDATVPFGQMFLLVFGESLAAFVGFLVTVFFSFHIWLMFNAMTTIEFCEKQMKRTSYDSSSYDRGVSGNIRAVLGDNMLLWLLPCSPPSGSGLYFRAEEPPSLRDPEAGPTMRTKKSTKLSESYGTTPVSEAAPESEKGQASSKSSGQQD
eukprot:TRINITY_DN81_c0_g1_i1.p1 TRINITY_DN81_c0_g1~~TRINITY_DN81_c0_g1_i1.p1  ORF type:complete len:347 (-),score=35.28 TRINITY_DN81_c0_g1_i1:103-1143(-)